MTERISIGQVYNEVLKLGGKFDSLALTVQRNCTDIALLQQRDANHGWQEEKRDKRYESLDDAVQAMRLSQAGSAAIGAVVATIVAALIMVVPQIIQALK